MNYTQIIEDVRRSVVRAVTHPSKADDVSEQIARLVETAWNSGHDKGYKAGYDKGHAEAVQSVAEMLEANP